MKRFWKPLAIAGVLFAALVLTPVRSVEKAVALRARTPEARASAEGRLRTDINVLASDEFEGRGPTTQGINKAADYIANEFKKAGLKPGGMGGTYFQHFTIPGARLLGPATLKFRGPLGQEIVLKQGVQFHPLGMSHSGGLNDVEVVFAGYGITGSDNFKYNDYDDVDVGGKVVVVLRDTPCATNSSISIDGQQRRQHGSLTEKMTKAEKRGALGILFVNDYDTAKDGDDLLDFNFLAAARSPVNLPALHLRRSILDSMLQSSAGRSLADIESTIDRELKPQSVALKGWKVSFEVKVKHDTLDLKNVIGVLDGKGPLANETVVIGAHYDHLGYGGSSSLARLKKMAIHNGADDNGSGTTAIIELARRFADDPDRQGRRLVFMAFSGEEMGLLGSAHYCKSPIFDLEKTVAMVNLDMVGRMQNNKLIIEGTGTAKGFSELIDKLNAPYGFTIAKKPGGFGPSDQASFYAKKVPVIFFFTGDHPDYHRPTDDADKINIEGMRRVVEMTEDAIVHFATVKERPEYVKLEGGGPRPAQGVRLGIRPEYADDKDGVLIGGVTDGFPAAKAGIKEGDRIVAMNGKQVKNIEAYMVIMQGVKRGDTLDVGIMRESKKQLVKIKID